MLKSQDKNQVAHLIIKSWTSIKSCGKYKTCNLESSRHQVVSVIVLSRSQRKSSRVPQNQVVQFKFKSWPIQTQVVISNKIFIADHPLRNAKTRPASVFFSSQCLKSRYIHLNSSQSRLYHNNNSKTGKTNWRYTWDRMTAWLVS